MTSDKSFLSLLEYFKLKGGVMNKEQFSAEWQQLKPYILDKWNRLTDEDMRQISGRYDAFIARIQEKYGVSREEIEEQFRSWRPNLRFENERDRELVPNRKDREEVSTAGKWLLAAGIPFLFLLGYLGTHYNAPTIHDTNYNSPSSANQTLYTTTPKDINQDSTISQNVRKALFANSELLNDLKDVRIDTSNGVVTIYGSVKTEDEKELITRLIEKTPGVIQVNNKVDVKL